MGARDQGLDVRTGSWGPDHPNTPVLISIEAGVSSTKVSLITEERT